MKLTRDIAQSIVDKTMNLIKYNVNIMNEKSIIVGSGDASRLDTYHQGAEWVLKKNRALEIKKGNPELLTGSQEGVNLPIRFNNKAVGVVGVTGDPKEVRIYGTMVQTMAELMLEQAFFWEQANIEEQARFSLVNDLIRQDPGKDSNTLRIRANILGYNLNLPRVVVVFEINTGGGVRTPVLPSKQLGDKNIWDHNFKKQVKKITEFLSLNPQDLFASGIGDRFVLLKQVEGNNSKLMHNLLRKLFDNLKSNDMQITAGVGRQCFYFEEIPSSFDQALQALEVGRKLFGPGQIYHTEELGLEKFLAKVNKKFRQNFYQEIFQDSFENTSTSKQLLETAKVFLQCDLKSGEAARRLFIHRNTLTYRIDKIRKKTGLNLYCLEDALKFKMALLCWQFDREGDM